MVVSPSTEVQTDEAPEKAQPFSGAPNSTALDAYGVLLLSEAFSARFSSGFLSILAVSLPRISLSRSSSERALAVYRFPSITVLARPRNDSAISEPGAIWTTVIPFLSASMNIPDLANLATTGIPTAPENLSTLPASSSSPRLLKISPPILSGS